jgi:hypothetical protein
MAIEKIRDLRQLRHWPGHMEADYIYTLGLAGERFFKEIKENGRIMGTRCKRCNLTYVPPRIYCERCFEKLGEWIEVSPRGTVYTFTIAHIDINGSKLEQPTIYAVIKIHGANGGLVHKIGEVNPKDVKIGMQVEAVFKPKEEREGSINDIKHFKPIT